MVLNTIVNLSPTLSNLPNFCYATTYVQCLCRPLCFGNLLPFNIDMNMTFDSHKNNYKTTIVYPSLLLIDSLV